ncbi:unnamed protein product [Effrenium voratum]|nr:unnamed protein product [Effrenium voratum]
MEKLKPSALPLLPLVLHPSRPTVVWAPGGEVLAYNESKGWEQPNVCHAAPIRALDAYVDAASPVTRWLSAGDDKMLMTWLEKDGAWELQEKLGHSKKITAAVFDRPGD